MYKLIWMSVVMHLRSCPVSINLSSEEIVLVPGGPKIIIIIIELFEQVVEYSSSVIHGPLTKSQRTTIKP